jgi:hypothetical protein
MALKHGKKPATYDRRDIQYSDARPDSLTITVPPSFGRGRDFADGPAPAGWGMNGNGPTDDNSMPAEWTAALQGAGCCTIADPSHVERMNAKDSGRPAVSVSGKTTIDQYIALSAQDGAAYDPVSGNNDNGLEIRHVLNYRQNPGFADDAGNLYKIGTYMGIEIANSQHLREAVWLFPGVSIGITVTQSMMDQIDSGKMWSVVPGMMDSQLGGHDVPLVGHPWGGLWTVITWGQRQVMSYNLLSKVCDEAWAYIDPERYSTVTGETYNGWRDADLEKFIVMAAQQKAAAPAGGGGKITGARKRVTQVGY